jgi:hypothetical protein
MEICNHRNRTRLQYSIRDLDFNKPIMFFSKRKSFEQIFKEDFETPEDALKAIHNNEHAFGEYIILPIVKK